MPVLSPYAIATGQAGQDRGQIQFYSLDSLIEADNEVRAIEALVGKVPLEALGFKVKGKSQEGRPAFSARMLLKLYVYGYPDSTIAYRGSLRAQCGAVVAAGVPVPVLQGDSGFPQGQRRFCPVVYRGGPCGRRNRPLLWCADSYTAWDTRAALAGVGRNL